MSDPRDGKEKFTAANPYAWTPGTSGNPAVRKERSGRAALSPPIGKSWFLSNFGVI